MTHANSTIAPVAKTTFKVGTYNALSDTFTSAVDLNDRASFWVVSVDMPQPKKVYSRSSTIRVPGERIAAWNYQNRHIKVTLQLLYGANPTALLASVQTLLAAIENPPYRLAFAAPNTSILTYADVVAVAHTIPYDGKLILNGAVKKIVLDFECLPGLPGDRLTLSNLVMNPGFEAPSGPSVYVFSDGLTNANAYSTLYGAAPGVASNLLTIAASSGVQFGSPAWGALNTWQVRFKFVTSLQATFSLHYTNGTNKLQAFTNGSELELDHIIGGTNHQLAITSAMTALTNGNFYWLKVTQFPMVAGNPPLVQATLYNDSAGAIGAAVTNGGIGPVATYDAVTALSGKPAIEAAGAALVVGGAFSNVNAVQLFGPGGWFNANFGAGTASGAWDQNTANTYTGGPATSYGAARIDAAPTGALNFFWSGYVGGLPSAGAITGMPVAAPGDVLAVSVWAKGSGLGSASASVILGVGEYDVNGNFLRQGSAVIKTGAQVNGAWTQLSGTYTTGASCVYAQFQIGVTDSGNGSANGIVWFDNAQCWDQTTVQAATGQTSMPYCELRFPQSPAQLLVSGLAGEIDAPAMAALGTFVSNFATGTIVTWALGRRSLSSLNAQLAGAPVGFQTSGNPVNTTPAISSVLDASSYGGYYLTTTLGNGFNPRAFSVAPGDMLGSYHVLSRAWTAESGGNLANVQTRVVTQQRSQAWFGLSSGADQVASFIGLWSAPMTAASTWTVADSGLMGIPPFPVGALTDPTQNYLTPRSQWQDTTPNGAFRAGWQCLLPVDAALLLGVTNNPANNTYAIINSWLWHYLDGLTTDRAIINDGPAATYSVETVALANAGHGAGGPGTQATGAPNVNLLADPYLTLDPQLTAAATSGAAGAAGVNQFVGYVSDSAGDVLPLLCDLMYTPLYLYPRSA